MPSHRSFASHLRLVVFLALAVLGAMSLAPSSHAAIVQTLGDESLVRLSKTIAEGRVTAVRSEWNAAHSQIFTTVTIQVSNRIKGDIPASGELVLRLLGGHVDDLVMEVVGQPTFEVDEDVIVFVHTTDFHHMPITGLYQGKLTVFTDPTTGVPTIAGRGTSRDQFVREIERVVAQEAGE